MRKATKIAASLFGLGSIAIGYQVGTAAEVSTPFADSANLGAQPTDLSSPVASQSASSQQQATASQSPETPAPANSNAANGSAPKASASTSSGSSQPVSSQPPASSANTTSKKSAAIAYRFGTIQVTVTKTGSKISDINLDIAGATGGRDQAFAYLVQYTIDANGTNYGNLSGATYTVVAFKQAVESALAKF